MEVVRKEYGNKKKRKPLGPKDVLPLSKHAFRAYLESFGFHLNFSSSAVGTTSVGYLTHSPAHLLPVCMRQHRLTRG